MLPRNSAHRVILRYAVVRPARQPRICKMGATKKATEKGQEDSNGAASAVSAVQPLRLRPRCRTHPLAVGVSARSKAEGASLRRSPCSFGSTSMLA